MRTPVSEMTKEEIAKFQMRARQIATRKGYPQLADDFASEIFVNFLKEPDRHATLDQLFIDFLRRTHGRPGTPGNNARIQAERSMATLDAAIHVAGHSEVERPDGEFAFLFRGREAEIYGSYFIDQISEDAIAKEYGVTPSRICQVLKSMKNQIRSHVMLAEARERMEWDETFGLYSVDWITI